MDCDRLVTIQVEMNLKYSVDCDRLVTSLVKFFLQRIAQSVTNIHQNFVTNRSQCQFQPTKFQQPLSIRNSVANRIFGRKTQNFRSKFAQFLVVN